MSSLKKKVTSSRLIPLPDINMSKLTLESVLMKNSYKPHWTICSLAKKMLLPFSDPQMPVFQMSS